MRMMIFRVAPRLLTHWRAVATGRAALMVTMSLAAGCADTTKFAPPCPVPSILGDAADITRYRDAAPGKSGRDVTDMVFSGKIDTIAGTCSAGPNNTLKATVAVAMTLSRGPAATGRIDGLAYFLAVSKGDVVIDKEIFPLQVDFPPNTDQVKITSQDINLVFPTPKGTTGASYSVTTGFQLTPAELAENRTRRSP